MGAELANLENGWDKDGIVKHRLSTGFSTSIQFVLNLSNTNHNPMLKHLPEQDWRESKRYG